MTSPIPEVVHQFIQDWEQPSNSEKSQKSDPEKNDDQTKKTPKHNTDIDIDEKGKRKANKPKHPEDHAPTGKRPNIPDQLNLNKAETIQTLQKVLKKVNNT